MNGLPWSDEELAILKRSYGRYGAEGSRRQLLKEGYERTLSAVYKKAYSLGYRAGLTKNTMSLTEALEIIHGYRYISRRTRNKGKEMFMAMDAVSYHPQTKIKWRVKEDVVYQIADRVADDNEIKHSSEWMPLVDAAKVFNVDHNYLRKAMKGKGKIYKSMYEYTKDIAVHTMFLRQHWYLCVEDVHKAAEAYRRGKNAKAKERVQRRQRPQVLQVRVQDRAEQGRRETTNGHLHAHVE